MKSETRIIDFCVTLSMTFDLLLLIDYINSFATDIRSEIHDDPGPKDQLNPYCLALHDSSV